MSTSAVRVAREALAVGEAALPAYGSGTARRDDTRPQRLARRLVLRQFLHTDHRGVVTLLGERSELRHVLGLSRVPRSSTLARAARRILADGHGMGLSTPARPASSNEPAPVA